MLGNHDYPKYDGSESLAEIAHSGIISLDNKAYELKGLRLAGVGDMWMGAIDLRPAFRGLDDDTFLLMISHNPEMSDHLTKYAGRIDLMLSGHLHGHQVNIFGPLQPRHNRVKSHIYGEVKLNGRGLVYITSGVGTSNLPMRLLARPEIVVVELDGAKGS